MNLKEGLEAIAKKQAEGTLSEIEFRNFIIYAIQDLIEAYEVVSNFILFEEIFEKEDS